jgi:hypothetical protein
MHGLRCNVTDSDPSVARPLQTAQPPVYCADDQANCTQGAKQIILWNQQEGVDNVVVPSGSSPGYSSVCGYSAGAQEDIFQ